MQTSRIWELLMCRELVNKTDTSTKAWNFAFVRIYFRHKRISLAICTSTRISENRCVNLFEKYGLVIILKRDRDQVWTIWQRPWRHLNWNKSRKRGNQKKDRASSYYAKECIYIINFQKDRTMKLRARRFHFWPVTKFFHLDVIKQIAKCWVIFFLIIRVFLSLGL